MQKIKRKGKLRKLRLLHKVARSKDEKAQIEEKYQKVSKYWVVPAT